MPQEDSMTDHTSPKSAPEAQNAATADATGAPKPPLPEAAKRALAEAEERRQHAKTLQLPQELGGREGPEPVRYGDWENKGIAVDF
ncbi:MAG: hypothetical protein ACJAVM_001208 [Sulfitobacter sp.]|jgi:hypothetical protein